LGKKKKGEYEYRLRWDDVIYESGELKVVAYKNGAKWAEEVVKTTGKATKLKATVDRNEIAADGKDLAFITIQITDKDGLVVPRSNNKIEFSIDGPGEIVATDNGDSYNMESFASQSHKAFNGLALVIVRAKAGGTGTLTVTAKSNGLKETKVIIKSN
jgi:beta-galactosidase